ncbi:hypothetical protein Tsubulata_034325 [Turnera subulata]|uniref:Zinc knuckle CX2CX4HX4C domain-containing protein n=1 Tax=Turnera subulata TaxID=218843 RepID=A0A9Q0JMJ4_9ROSI|nr:hypothetical protein Tsubulata_034325 [Turnera subulata]
MAAITVTGTGDQNRGTETPEREEVEEDVLVLEETVLGNQGVQSFCALGKFLGLKHVNPQAFTTVMTRIWNPLWGLEVELSEAPIWVQMLNIPLNLRTKTNVMNIASKAGRFLSFDEKSELGWGKFVRARILLNVDHPLKKSLVIRKGGGTNVEVMFRYEGIPNFCYIYGKLGHVLKECEQRSEESDEEERITYGEWLRASPRKPYSVKMEASHNPAHMSGSVQAPVESEQPEGARGVVRQLQMDREVLLEQLTRVLNLKGPANHQVHRDQIAPPSLG